jgi:hypothetical protein
VEILTRAWADRQAVSIHYWAADRAQPQERVIEPYFLEVSRFERLVTYWRMIVSAMRCERSKLKRIQHAELLPNITLFPMTLDPYTWLQSSWASCREMVEFSSASARKSRDECRKAVWHHSQQLEPLSTAAAC